MKASVGGDNYFRPATIFFILNTICIKARSAWFLTVDDVNDDDDSSDDSSDSGDEELAQIMRGGVTHGFIYPGNIINRVSHPPGYLHTGVTTVRYIWNTREKADYSTFSVSTPHI
jgi:hypothetical protein